MRLYAYDFTISRAAQYGHWLGAGWRAIARVTRAEIFWFSTGGELDMIFLKSK